jgi:micrococcal nuclease
LGSHTYAQSDAKSELHPPRGIPRAATLATVRKVVDGDTLRVTLNDGTQTTVRLIGIDTPETKDPDEPVGCFGPEASARIRR